MLWLDLSKAGGSPRALVFVTCRSFWGRFFANRPITTRAHSSSAERLALTSATRFLEIILDWFGPRP